VASIKKRGSGQWRARYRDSAGREHAKHFTRKADAQRWLVRGCSLGHRVDRWGDGVPWMRSCRETRCSDGFAPQPRLSLSSMFGSSDRRRLRSDSGIGVRGQQVAR
jgi:hypothetical protein